MVATYENNSFWSRLCRQNRQMVFEAFNDGDVAAVDDSGHGYDRRLHVVQRGAVDDVIKLFSLCHGPSEKV